MNNTELIAEWDAAATPDERGFHNGAGWARDNWRAIRDALRAEVEWEYGHLNGGHIFAPAEGIRNTHRRIKAIPAGPWVEVQQ